MSVRRIVAMMGLLSSAALLGTGCAAKLAIQTLEPAPINLGKSTEIAIVHTEGRRSARETLINEFVKQARERGHFQVVDRSEEGMTAKIAGRNVTIEGGESGLTDSQWGIRFDVLEWTADRESETKTNAEGKSVKVTTYTGTVLLGVTIFDGNGKAVAAEKEYEGVYSDSDKDASKDSVTDAAATVVVNKVLADITPKPVTRRVQLDEDDEAQKPIIATAQNGSIAQAAADMKTYFESNPNNAGAAYNLAVFTDAMGDYDEALALYDKALSLGNKDFYSSARAECAKRKAAADALAE